jgi:hypothetical protein
MTHLAFELISDVKAAHPYVTVYLLEDSESYDSRRFDPFMELAVEKDNDLVLTIYKIDKPRQLSLEQWDEIAVQARGYHQEILDSGEDW